MSMIDISTTGTATTPEKKAWWQKPWAPLLIAVLALGTGAAIGTTSARSSDGGSQDSARLTAVCAAAADAMMESLYVASAEVINPLIEVAAVLADAAYGGSRSGLPGALDKMDDVIDAQDDLLARAKAFEGDYAECKG